MPKGKDEAESICITKAWIPTGQFKGSELGNDMLRLGLQSRGQETRPHGTIPAQDPAVKRELEKNVRGV